MIIPYRKVAKMLKRLSGLSTPLFGISWLPAPSEIDIAERLITFLSDRRILFGVLANENLNYAAKSIIKIRERLTCDLQELDGRSWLSKSLERMRQSSRLYLDVDQSTTGSLDYSKCMHLEIMRLRKVFALEIGQISCRYGIDLSEDMLLLYNAIDKNGD